jgi:hypothetical protein
MQSPESDTAIATADSVDDQSIKLGHASGGELFVVNTIARLFVDNQNPETKPDGT